MNRIIFAYFRKGANMDSYPMDKITKLRARETFV